jgi:hypothetical protein
VAGVAASIPGLGSLLGEGSADAPALTGDTSAVDGDVADSQSVVAHVRDVRAGIIDLHINGATIKVENPQLARAIAQSAR